MKISVKCDYAIKCLIDLAMRGTSLNIRIQDISARYDIPNKFLQNIMVVMKNAGLIQSKMGPGGGYILKRTPEAISLLDVVKAIDGPLELMSYPEQRSGEAGAIENILESIWKSTADATSKHLADIKLSQLVREFSNRGVHSDYII